MKYVPQSVTRMAGRTLLKLNANAPTLLVVGGVVGMGATVVMAAKATRKIEPVLEHHRKGRMAIGYVKEGDKAARREQRADIATLYTETGVYFARLYGPTIVVGTLSTASILYGHKVLRGRHVATMMAYTGLQEQFISYRKRVAQTLGDDMERDIYDGARGEYVEDPDHKGEYKLETKWDGDQTGFLRPWFDESNVNWLPTSESNLHFLKGVQSHANTLLNVRGYLLLSEVYRDLGLPLVSEAVPTGWLRDDRPEAKDGFVDFGFMTSNDPNTVAFRNGAEQNVQFNFNIDGIIWDLIDR